MARVESLIRAEVDVPLPETKEDRKNNYIFISKAETNGYIKAIAENSKRTQ